MKYKSENVRILPFFILILTCAVGRSSADSAADSGKLEILVISAHTDEGEIYAGGISAIYAKMGLIFPV